MSSLFYMFALTTTAFLYNWFIYDIVPFQEALSILRPCDGVTTLYWNPVCEGALIPLADVLSIEGIGYEIP
jgi:hypothetical protein